MKVVHLDQLSGDHGATAMVEFTEASLREFSRIIDAEAKRAEEAARTETDRLYARVLAGDAMRFQRVANELRRHGRHVNGAATAATAPRPEPQEAHLS